MKRTRVKTTQRRNGRERRWKKNRKKKKKEIPVTNGGCSRSNESPRWSPTGNKEKVRGERFAGWRLRASWNGKEGGEVVETDSR